MALDRHVDYTSTRSPLDNLTILGAHGHDARVQNPTPRNLKALKLIHERLRHLLEHIHAAAKHPLFPEVGPDVESVLPPRCGRLCGGGIFKN